MEPICDIKIYGGGLGNTQLNLLHSLMLSEYNLGTDKFIDDVRLW